MISKLMVTGTRDITPSIKQLVKFALNWVAGSTLCTEDALLLQGEAKGVDTAAHNYWTAYGLPDKGFPADWETYKKAAGGIRNQQMVDFGPDLWLAFPSGSSRGTWDAVRRAKNAEIPGFVLSDQDSMYELYYYTILKPGEFLD